MPPCATTCVGSTDRGKFTADTYRGNTYVIFRPSSDDTTEWDYIYMNGEPGYSYSDAFVEAKIDISRCNFISPPIITTSLDMDRTRLLEAPEVAATGALIQGATATTQVTAESFTVYIKGNYVGTDAKLSKDGVVTYNDIHWRAFGYVC